MKNETKIQMQRTLLPFHTLKIWFHTIGLQLLGCVTFFAQFCEEIKKNHSKVTFLENVS